MRKRHRKKAWKKYLADSPRRERELRAIADAMPARTLEERWAKRLMEELVRGEQVTRRWANFEPKQWIRWAEGPIEVPE